MAPKAADGVSADAANFQFLFAALKHNKGAIEPAWDSVAAECGISYGRNASAKFKEIIKKHGYKLEGGKFVAIDGSAPAAISTAKEAKAKKAKTPASNKKRKLAVEDDGEDKKEEDTPEPLKAVEDVNADGEGHEDDEGTDELA